MPSHGLDEEEEVQLLHLPRPRIELGAQQSDRLALHREEPLQRVHPPSDVRDGLGNADIGVR